MMSYLKDSIWNDPLFALYTLGIRFESTMIYLHFRGVFVLDTLHYKMDMVGRLNEGTKNMLVIGTACR